MQVLAQASQKLKRDIRSVVETASVKHFDPESETEDFDIGATVDNIMECYERSSYLPDFVVEFCTAVVNGKIRIVKPKVPA